ncbi:hypothetical protein ACSXD4_08080 [Clostridium perfringens]
MDKASHTKALEYDGLFESPSQTCESKSKNHLKLNFEVNKSV